MKKVINQWPYLVALLPQFFVEDYLWITIIVILIGSISRFFLKEKYMFVKLFILELIVFAIILFIFNDRIFYLKGMLENLELPTIISSVLFLLFNALNITILFFTGYKLSSLFIHKKEELNLGEI